MKAGLSFAFGLIAGGAIVGSLRFHQLDNARERVATYDRKYGVLAERMDKLGQKLGDESQFSLALIQQGTEAHDAALKMTNIFTASENAAFAALFQKEQKRLADEKAAKDAQAKKEMQQERKRIRDILIEMRDGH